MSASGGATSSNTTNNQGGVGTIDVTSHTGGLSPTGTSSVGGSAATGGIAGTGGSVSSGPVSSIDILYMIDNSSSMADKQQVLAASLPQLLAQLAQPNCVDASGQVLGASQITQTGPSCASGKLEFKAINDIHIGIVSSSLYIPVTDARWTSAGGIWSQIYGDDDVNIAPGDVHMVESVIPRTGLPGPTSSSPTADPKNGHEYNTAREDLEYACIFALEGAAPARPCGCTAGSTDYVSCKYLNPNDCCDVSYSADAAGGPAGTFNKPLCQNPTTGAAGTTQYYAKGYPGLREIAVLHDYAVGPTNYTDKGGIGNSIVTSICPKVLAAGQESSPGYGYNPVARAIIERVKVRLQN